MLARWKIIQTYSRANQVREQTIQERYNRLLELGKVFECYTYPQIAWISDENETLGDGFIEFLDNTESITFRTYHIALLNSKKREGVGRCPSQFIEVIIGKTKKANVEFHPIWQPQNLDD